MKQSVYFGYGRHLYLNNKDWNDYINGKVLYWDETIECKHFNI